MVFHSLTFAIFLAVVLGVHHLVPMPWRARKAFLLAASALFYAAWNPPFVLLLAGSAVLDWIAARRLHAARTPAARRGWLLASLVGNLGTLSWFKYGGLLQETFAAAARTVGVDWTPAPFDVVLPVGISFYTFQTLSYTLDVHAGRLAPADSFLDYGLYVAFFPQLVAGPIVRAGDFLPQCAERRRASAAEAGWGCALLVLGLFLKVVVADHLLAPLVDRAFAAPRGLAATDAWGAALGFTGQIYADFSGYSLCALGAAHLLGFRLRSNFRFPLAAVGFSDFWRRWHVSLSEWFRDYVYVPLGGNRRGSARTAANGAATMLLGGLWHGAAWKFGAWGAVHGALLALEGAMRPLLAGRAWTAGLPARILGAGATLAAVAAAFVLFRARDGGDAAALLAAMAGAGGERLAFGPGDRAWLLLVVGALVAGNHLLRDTTLEAAWDRLPWWIAGPLLGTALALVALAPPEDRAFLYFQF